VQLPPLYRLVGHATFPENGGILFNKKGRKIHPYVIEKHPSLLKGGMYLAKRWKKYLEGLKFHLLHKVDFSIFPSTHYKRW